MPLDDLVSVIETLQQRIRDHDDTLRQNEYRTRMALIDPLLTALGWDVADPSQVMPEYDVSGKRADYALLSHEGEATVFLEAKRLGESLSGHRSQVVAYASELGIRYPALTNGNDWEMFDNSRLVPIEQRKILEVSIVSVTAATSALQLLLLWRTQLNTGKAIAAKEPLKAIATPTSLPHPRIVKDPPPASLPPLSPPSGDGWVSLREYRARRNQLTPSAIRLSDGQEFQINRWNQILIQVAKFLIRGESLSRAVCPIGPGRGGRLVHWEPVRSNGNPFGVPHRLSNGLFLETKYDSIALVNHSKLLLERLGEDPSLIWVKAT